MVSRLLRAAGELPLWCGDHRETTYRVMRVFAYGRTKIVTVHRLDHAWTMDTTEFRDSRVEPSRVVRRVSRRLLPEEVSKIISALERDQFWRLSSEKPDERGYKGPVSLLEGRSLAGYQHILRELDTGDIAETTRTLMFVAGIRPERETVSLACSLTDWGVPLGTITVLNQEPFSWTNVEVEIDSALAPFVCPSPDSISANDTWRITIRECRDADGTAATKAWVVRVGSDQGECSLGFEPSMPAR